MKLCVVLCVLLVCSISFSASKRYDGYKLYRITFERGGAAQVQSLIDQIEGAEIWMLSMARRTADVFVAPNAERLLLDRLRRNGLAFNLLNDDIQGGIDGTALG